MRSRQATSRQPKRTPRDYDPIVIISKDKRVPALVALFNAVRKDNKEMLEDEASGILERSRSSETHRKVKLPVWFDRVRVNLRSYDELYGTNAGRKALTAAGVLDVAPPVVQGKLDG